MYIQYIYIYGIHCVCIVYLPSDGTDATTKALHARTGVINIHEQCVCVCVCVCVAIPFILDVRLVDAPAGVTQEEGHTGFLHLLSAVLALIFLTRRIQPSLSPSSTVKSIFVYPRINHSPPDSA